MRNLFFVSNALDDTTRIERDIVTDSPAASRKVFLLLKAARKAGVRAMVLSLGRGKQDGTGRYFRSKVCRVDGVPVIYLPFLHYPILSELLSLFSSVPILWRMHRKKGKKTALFYNRLPAYLPALITAKMLRFETVLDLEDGETDLSQWSLSGIKSRILRRVFDSLCSGGALLACHALECTTKLRPTQCCYGTSETLNATAKWDLSPVTVLLGGTVSYDTGAQVLINAIGILRDESPPWARNLRFEVTGKGDCLGLLKALGEDARQPDVVVHGRTTDDEYQEILARTQVGLALKPNSGKLAHTTFPSKVIEFASHDILVVTTDISDVRKVLADGAIYLAVDDPRLLIEKLCWIVENRPTARDLSLNGVRAVSAVCAPEIVGHMLSKFLFKSSTGVHN